MPNHVTTVLEAPKHVLDSLKSDDREVDFNKIKQMPAEDDPIFTASYTEFAPGLGGWSMDGYSPLEWAREHWDTKWNAYDTQRLSDTQVQFDTAWSHPEVIVTELSIKFPDDEIKVKYADEDISYNLGEYTIRNGVEVESRDIVEGSDEAFDFAARIKYGMSGEELRKEWDED